MKKILSLILLNFIFSFGLSQTVNIQWQGYRVLDYGIEKKTVPNFVNEKLSFDQNNVFFNMKQVAGERNLEITNLQWKAVSAGELYDLNKSQITAKEIAETSYQNYKGNRWAYISVATFKNEKGVIKRLESFTLVDAAMTFPSMERVGTTNNPLTSGGFYKIKVDKSGVFKITSQFLQSNGINPSSVNPKNFRIYGNGGIMLPEHNQDIRYDALQENAILVVGENDGVWNDGDYALFYAQGPDGYNLYDTTNGNGYKRNETRFDAPQHVKNIYEDFSYYFINFDVGPGKRITTIDVNLPSSLISRYDAYQYINEDEVNLKKFGKTWLDDAPFTSPKTVVFNTNSAIQSGDQIRFRAQVVGYESMGNSIKFTLNGQNQSTQTVPVPPPGGAASDYLKMPYSGIISGLQGNTLTFDLEPNISANPNGLFYFDYAEVQYKENLTFNGTQMNFRDFSIDSGSGQTYGFNITNAGGIEYVWDVSDVTNANQRVNKTTGTNFNFGYVANNPDFNNEFVAFRSDAAFEPAFVGVVENQNLQQLQNVDYLIITKPEMFGQAQRLANYHETVDNYNVEIIDVNKIYNEYSSGGQDLTAIRDFITHLNSPSGSLKYVFILGDATFDFKNRISNNYNIVPAFQSEDSGSYAGSYVTDDYFVMTSPQTSRFTQSILPDLPIGRLPAANVSEATTLIDKTLAYNNKLPGQSTPFGVWRMKMDFVADDDKDGGIPFHNYMNNALVNTFEGTTGKPEYNIRKLYLDSFTQQSTSGGPTYPQVNQAIMNDVSNSLFIYYFGHGGTNGWAQERALVSLDVQNFANYSNVFSRFPVISTITCQFCLWDDPNIFSAGEQVIKHQRGGSSTMITSSRAISVRYGEDFTDNFVDKIFELQSDDFLKIGDAHRNAKLDFGIHADHLKVNFLGDPAMKLARPKRLLVVDEIQTPVPNLIRALDFVKIIGHINNPDGTLNTNFNGKVAINIFDKRLNKSTLNNDGHLTPILNYTEEGSAIVKATGTAVNGQFTVEFYVPNDINYTVGTGRILSYADNNVIDVFNNQDYQVGDINPNGIDDDEPPKVKLYMNNTNFANGGITDQNPMLLACITDDTGINSTGSGIGHDIVTYLDGEIINTIVLNDFYSSGEGFGCVNPDLKDYQKGYATYPFRNLKPGEHTLTFKVWDINNNSTTATLNFVVKDEANQSLVINRLLNWPNPFTDKTYIQFEHNCDDILDVNVQIYTITGKLVRTLSQSITAEPFLEGYRTPRQAIEWDGRDDFGDLVGKGTYIFKVYARSQNQDKCKGGATAVEKMVILK